MYLKLDALNLATSGGRASAVGVGGLTLGGGFSFFSPRLGLVWYVPPLSKIHLHGLLLQATRYALGARSFWKLETLHPLAVFREEATLTPLIPTATT